MTTAHAVEYTMGDEPRRVGSKAVLLKDIIFIIQDISALPCTPKGSVCLLKLCTMQGCCLGYFSSLLRQNEGGFSP